jgi:hypothetical protein
MTWRTLLVVSRFDWRAADRSGRAQSKSDLTEPDLPLPGVRPAELAMQLEAAATPTQLLARVR